MRSILEEQVEQYLRLRARFHLRSSFPAELEAAFEVERLECRSPQVAFTATLALVFYDLFLVADYARHPALIWRCVLLRICVASPVILATVFAARWRMRAAVQESLVLASVGIAGGVVLALAYDLSRIESVFSQTGFILIVFFGSLILRQQFGFAVVTLLAMLAEDVFFIETDRWMTMDDKVTSLLLVTTSVSLTMVANFIMERQERISFAHSLKEGFHSRALAELNRKLTGLSQVDGLTGLSNRRHFDERFATMWHEAIETGGGLSLVMIDIDHFKRLNDTFGHIAGDQVLVRMGEILGACVRTGDDVVARFGGEEFILLLGGAGHEEAHGIAEELRRLVSTSTLTMNDADEARWPVTVSCGLATIVPTVADDRLRLIAEADLALYAAKRGGRNRVACRVCEAVVPEQRRQTDVVGLTATNLQIQ